jgi:predicted enzyme related to lactoylglutathione lyase
MKVKFAHINIVASDWKKLSRFYIDVFNCKPKPPERNLQGNWLDDLTGLKSAHIQGAHLLLPGYSEDGPTIEIFKYTENAGSENRLINKEGFAHIAFAVDDVESCLKLLFEKGGSLVGKVVKTEIEGAGKIHVAYAMDPEGNIIEIQKWEE